MKNMVIIIIFICFFGTAIAGTAIYMTDDGNTQSDRQMGSITNAGITILNIDSDAVFPGGEFIIYVSDGYLFICSNVDIEFVEGPYRDPDKYIIFWYRPDVKIIYYLPYDFFDDYSYITFPDLPLIPFPPYDVFIPITWPPVDPKPIQISPPETIQIVPLETVQIYPPFETVRIFPPFETVQIDRIQGIQKSPIVWEISDPYLVKPLTE